MNIHWAPQKAQREFVGFTGNRIGFRKVSAESMSVARGEKIVRMMDLE